jgi:endogenous inhibitor of DNA gyrase (YacG/DUF329 family)
VEKEMAASVACSFFFDAEPLGDLGSHKLDACALCSKPLTRNSDIFMYKGDTPFCSEECRYEQMHFDAAYKRQAGRKSQRSDREASSVSRKADVSVATY